MRDAAAAAAAHYQPAPAAPHKPARGRANRWWNIPKYGTGTVVRREGDGEDAKITVSFPRLRPKETRGEIRRIEKKLMNTKDVNDKTRTQEAEADGAQEGGAQSQTRLRRGARIY